MANAKTPLKQSPDSGLYQYADGTDSPFTRTVTISRPSGVELVVKSEVAWAERATPKTIVVEYHLFDWIK